MTEQPAKTLRRRLFGSHLLVMGVALTVLILGALVVAGLGELAGGKGGFGSFDGREGGSPVAPLVGLGAAVVAAALVSWQITRRLAEPLEKISAATRELAAGRYDVNVPGSDTFELDAVANDVNVLAAELHSTEERRLRLIGDLAHELRNPLSTIEGTMEALLDGVVDANDDTFARIGREAARLRRLADDLSSLSAAGEPGRFERETVDVAAVVSDVVAQLEPQALAKGLTLVFGDQHAVQASISGDRDRLTQVFMNVIGNAVQYTDDGSVAVRLEGAADGVRVIVTDTGRGLASEDQARIFERFHRVDQQFSDGTGVGLAIANLIVGAHAGEIVAESPGLGQGTTIRISLPAGAG